MYIRGVWVLDYWKRFSPLIEGFKEATQKKDWDEVAVLDERLRQELAEVDIDESSKADMESYVEFLKRLQRVLALVQSGAEKHRVELVAALKQLGKDQKAAATYQNASDLS